MEPIKFPENILEWLHKRGLSDAVIEAAHLSWNGEEIVIPVFDGDHKHLFNKYRRDPFGSEGPKYRYEKGGTTVLFNLHTIKETGTSPVFICEGEFDALLLNSKGQYAVTSTGGSSNFKKEWAEIFDGKNVYIAYDKDDAGFKGAMKVQGILPHAKTIILPEQGMEGNDVTDFFQTNDIHAFFKLDARTYPIPREPSGMPTEKKELKAIVKEFGDAADALLEIKRDMQGKRMSVRHVLIFLQYVNSRYETFSHNLKSFERRYNGASGDSTDVRRAKEVPITQFIRFSYDGFARCIWHEEKTGSMKYNKPGTKYGNTVKCFGCGAMGDPIDVIMQLRKVEFGEAVKIILNHHA